MMRGLLAGLALLLWLVVPAAAADRKINDFYGEFEGNAATAEGKSESYAENRGSTVTIAPDKTGFSVSWTTLQLKDEPSTASSMDASVKTQELTFKPSGSPGVWFGTKNPATLAPDKPFSWARITGDTLVVTTIILQANGDYDVTSYERTLSTDNKMDLRFTRWKNGDLKRRVSATLDRVTN